MTRLPFLCAALSGTALAAAAPSTGGTGERPPFHSVAVVTDPLSHGTLGDSKLSLDEAIRLHNGTLLVSALSLAEQAQLSLIPGTTPTADVTWIEIDSEYASVITVQQDLTPVVDSIYGLLIRGSGGMPLLDFSGANITRGFEAPANSITLQNLVLYGGPTGLDVLQGDVSGDVGCSLRNVRFEGQSSFALRVASSVANGVGRLVMENCEFVNVPVAVQQLEPASGRTTIFEAHECTLRGVTDGFVMTRGAGGFARYTFDRVIVEATGNGIAIGMNGAQGRNTYFEGELVRVRAASCLRLDGAADAQTWLECAGWQLLAAPAGIALQLGSVGDDVRGTWRELVTRGDAAVHTGGGSLPLAFHNLRAAAGTVSLACSATQAMTFEQAACTGCVVSNVGSAAIAATDSCFVGGSLVGAPAADFVLTGCYAANVGANVLQNQSLLQPQLGSMQVTPDDALIGGAITIAADLPSGLVALLILGVPMVPSVHSAPFSIYCDPAQFVIVPGAYQLQQGYTWMVPNLGQFLGLDFVAQSIVLPGAGVVAPALQMPPPWRFVLVN